MKRPRTYSRRHGFTLPELLVTIGLLAIMGIAIGHMTIFISKSQAITMKRLATVTKGQRLDRELNSLAQDCQVAILYSNYGPWGITDTLSTANVNALWQPSVHLGSGEAGNYLVMVELWSEEDYLTTEAAIATAQADDIPPPVRRIYGLYAGPPTWINKDDPTVISAAPDYVPVRRFEFEFTAAEGAIGGTSGIILEDLLPDEDDASSHEIIGYVDGGSVDANPLFQLRGLDTVVIDLPLSLRDSDQSASVRFQTTLRFTNR